jgi:polyhydroxybutyrate depolymerase
MCRNRVLYPGDPPLILLLLVWVFFEGWGDPSRCLAQAQPGNQKADNQLVRGAVTEAGGENVDGVFRRVRADERGVDSLVTLGLTVDGRARACLVFLPKSFSPGMPVVLNLHGYSDNAGWQMEYSGMNAVADTAGFIVAYPDGIWPGFNTEFHVSTWTATLPKVDDVQFISTLLDTLKARYEIDMSRVYCCGFSNGGHMTQRLAFLLGHRFAAGAAVASCLLDTIAHRLALSAPFPMLMCNGTADNNVRYDPSASPQEWSVPRSLEYWIQRNGCQVPGDSVSLPDLDTSDGSSVDRFTYRTAGGERRVMFFKVLGGGHTWPRGTFTWPTAGQTNRDVDMNSEIWNFVKEHRNPLVNVAFGEEISAKPTCVRPGEDSMTITGRIRNPEGHPVFLFAQLVGTETGQTDSVQLLDDGQHGDGAPSDGEWGAVQSTEGLAEDLFRVTLITHDYELHTRQQSHRYARIMTEGPIDVESYSFVGVDTMAIPGKLLSYRICLKNYGATATIRDVTAKVRCPDTAVVLMNTRISYGDLAPGVTSTGSVVQKIYYKPSCPTGRPVTFFVDISSGDDLYWTAQFEDVVTDLEALPAGIPGFYVLEQNYPNPFNPSTVLQFGLPTTSHVRLVVYSVLGEQVTVLVNESLDAGYHSVRFDASGLASGIYFYRMQAGDFVQTRKLLLIR